ncbi:pyruvate dehydrogenase complex E1 component subunit beta [Prosthecomicrobium pneumaticum]|uniref:2-oxoglutarate dehydrogenase E1 component n=1 Tax=Prosthecomicrobium pneumaticum TaxID=81895 RepID=A0A7W9CVP7_9HYPH|nr:pyruvate dehydrogenase complex E1 component subunit beta [Prosthecomicrobium pneumaticum]MBB5752222.1 2-oxoisovalerate dehydrogenase E1 component [Prosthecomicrobium pneumaticum]
MSRTSSRAAASGRSLRPVPNLEIPQLLALYEKMVLLRRFESVAQIACRKGETPGFLHLYIGEEATAVGVCAHLRSTDWVTSTHRGHGHALAKGMDPNILMAELFGKRDGCCGGRGGTMHLYDRSVGLFGTNGIVAAGISHAVGVGMSARRQGRDDIGVAFFGDGATNHAGFHESLNFAGIQRAPAVFVCENNLYATATPLKTATLNPEIASRAAAYGIPGVAVDGNDVLAVWEVTRDAVNRARRGEGPTLIEAKTYRTVGHHEGDPVVGTYRTQEEVDAWAARDPIKTFRERLVDQFEAAAAGELDAIDGRIENVVQEALEFARRSPEPDPATSFHHVFAEPLNPAAALAHRPRTGGPVTSWLDAVRDGIAEEMRRDAAIMYFGEGTGERGGTFAHTKNLFAEFGPERMIDTPISEQGFTGAAVGASATGARTIADLMFADFMFEAAGQIVLQAAKLRYMSNGQMNAPMVVRVGAGAVRSAGPHHSGAYHPVWAHIPGLIVCLPSTPADAKGLMKTALRGSDPVLMLEMKALFATKGEVPDGEHLVPFGVARIAREGRDLTIASAGQLVHRALEAAEALAKEGIEAEVIDLRTIMPLDVKTVAESVAKTHRLLIVDEGWAMCGVGAELGQAMNELAFDDLDAPVGRLHSEPISHPLAPALERTMLVDAAKVVAAAKSVLAGRAPVPWHWRHPALAAAVPATAAPSPVAAPVPPALAPAAPVVPAEALSSAAAGGEPITMPFGDLTVSEGTILRWAKAEGDTVKAGELVAEIETDKAVVEIEAPVAGRLAIELREGTVVPMGGRIGAVH